MAASAVATKILLRHPTLFLSGKVPSFYYSNLGSVFFLSKISTKTRFATSVAVNSSSGGRNGQKNKKGCKEKSFSAAVVKRRTRSEKEFDEQAVITYGGGSGRETHIPVMLGEVLEVFSSVQLRSFVDCTLGAAGHSSAIIQAHSEMQLHIGLDIDPIAQELAKARIHAMMCGDSCDSPSDLKVYTFLKSYRDLRNVLHEVDENLERHGVDGILMDLGMSSMQVNNSERGFSILCDGPLDMRMNPQGHDRQILKQKIF